MLPLKTERRPRQRSRTALAALALGASVVAGCLDPNEPGNLVPRTVELDPALPSMEVGGTQLHTEAFGDPAHPMVMVLHGGPGADYRSLLPLQALAAAGYYVVFWDQRGAGLSMRHDADGFSFARYLEDLRLVLERYSASDEQPVVFIGHSWGAMYATWFFNEYGDYGGRIRGAILSEPGAFTKPQLDAFLDRFFGVVSVAGEDFNDIVWGSQFISPADHARADYLAITQIPAEHLNLANPAPSWRYGAVAQFALLRLADEEGFDFTTNLDEFSPKVLFLRGSLNETMPLEHQQELARSYPDATVVTIEGARHEMIWEKPDEYLEHTRAYFDEIDFTAGVR